MRTHRSLEAWQAARQLARLGLRLGRDHWRPFAAAAFSQLQRSSLSVQLNIAEGYAKYSRAQLHQGLTIAYGSAVETEEILELLMEEGVIEVGPGREALVVAQRCQRLVLGLIRRYRPRGTSPP